jgi:integrase
MRTLSNLSLFWTDSQFRIDGTTYGGLPIFVRLDTMRIELMPTEYSIHFCVVRGRSRSPKTWRGLGYTLCAFLRFMEAHGLNWRQPQEEYLAHFRSHLERKPTSKRPLVRATVARQMNIVCAFYEWAFRKGYLTNLPFTREIVRTWNRGMLSHLQAERLSARPILVPTVPKPRGRPRYFNREDQERLFAALGERDRLMMEWALYTGAREFEICALTLDDMPAPSVYRSQRAYGVTILGKNRVVADLCVPTWLLDRTYQYIKFYGRAETARAAMKRGKAVHDNIFLSRWGDPLQPDSLYKAFVKALKLNKINGRVHDLRHTYAISTLHKLMLLPKHANTNGLAALIELRDLMRHASFTSTEIYLGAYKHYLTLIDSNLFELPERYRNA